MSSRWGPLVVWAALMTGGLTAGRAAADESVAEQRARIASNREAIQQRYDAKEHDCAQRFVVTSCLNAARKERRDALVPLRQDELRIDAAERKQRAVARLDEIEAKRRADAVRDAAAPPETPKAPVAAAAPNLPASPIVGLSSRPRVSTAEREEREAVNQARFDANQVEAQRRRQAAEARNARRAAAGKVARPLPAPPAASSP